MKSVTCLIFFHRSSSLGTHALSVLLYLLLLFDICFYIQFGNILNGIFFPTRRIHGCKWQWKIYIFFSQTNLPRKPSKRKLCWINFNCFGKCFPVDGDIQVNYMTDLVCKNVFLLTQYRFIPLHLYFHPCQCLFLRKTPS